MSLSISLNEKEKRAIAALVQEQLDEHLSRFPFARYPVEPLNDWKQMFCDPINVPITTLRQALGWHCGANQPSESAKVAAPNAKQVNLKNFVKWSSPDPDVILPLKLDGESMNLLVGLDHPNGVKAQIISDSPKKGWSLQLKTSRDIGSPFDSYGELMEGFSLYLKDHNFDKDTTPEVVVAASDGMLETYVWVFSYNFVFSENNSSPLNLIWFGKG